MTKVLTNQMFTKTCNKPFETTVKKVAIVGGGCSGIYALKTTLEDGHVATLFEASNHIGGLWKHHATEYGTVWDNVHATSSKTFLHPSDFPFPDDVPVFPHHTHVFEHLERYVAHFRLDPHICLSHKIINASYDGTQWSLLIEHNHYKFTETFDALIVCVGQNQKPAYPQDAVYQNFSGCTMHSYEYKHPIPDMYGKNILIIGGGESASDIATEVSRVAKCVYMSIRNGQWFLEKHTGGRLAFDTRFSRKSRILATNYGNNWIVKLYEMMYATSNGEGGHGINEWRPTVPLMNEFINKSRSVLDQVVRGKVIPRAGVTNIIGDLVWFRDEEKPAQIDMIIFATGYHRNIPFLSDKHQKAYKLVFDPDVPSLAYVGFVRPVFGSITALAELQARWVSAYLADRCKLPSSATMWQEIENDDIRHSKIFPSKHKRVPQLVSHFEYADYIIRQLGARPNYLKLFLTDNKKWRVLLNAPWTPFESLVTHPQKGAQAYENLLHEYEYRRKIIGPSLFKLMIWIILTTIISSLFFLQITHRMWTKARKNLTVFQRNHSLG